MEDTVFTFHPKRMTLVCDTREADVEAVLLSKYSPMQQDSLGFQIRSQQLKTGDFVLLGESDTMIACFERKTLVDFANSIKDLRMENRHGMVELRKDTDCDLYFIIETSNPFPKETKFYSRVPFREINKAIVRLMAEDKIFVVWSQGVEMTSQKLMDFLVCYSNRDELQDSPTTTRTLALRCLTRLRGIALPFATTFLRTRSISSIFAIPREEIEQMRTAGGKLANKNARESLISLRNDNPRTAALLLSAIPGVTKQKAANVLETHSLSRITTFDPQLMNMFITPMSTAERAYDVLHYSDKQTEPTKQVQGYRLADYEEEESPNPKRMRF